MASLNPSIKILIELRVPIRRIFSVKIDALIFSGQPFVPLFDLSSYSALANSITGVIFTVILFQPRRGFVLCRLACSSLSPNDKFDARVIN